MGKIKILVAFSGGKDSLASLLWAIHESGFKRENIEAVYCDTGWEHEDTYKHIEEATSDLGVKLVTLRSKEYAGMLDLAKKKGRFPSAVRRFCTEKLKSVPMIDYILDECKCHVVVIQGIRKDESKARSMMQRQCTFFKYYFTPYGHDKNGKPKYHTYRRKEVLSFREKYLDDVIRPCFHWTGQDTIDYILTHGLKPNPLYYQGAQRVGCYPCIMSNHQEMKSMIDRNPKYIDRVREAEKEVGRTFFPPSFIPHHARKSMDLKSRKKIAFIDNVVAYIKSRNATLDIFEEDHDRSCMSFYGICE